MLNMFILEIGQEFCVNKVYLTNEYSIDNFFFQAKH